MKDKAKEMFEVVKCKCFRIAFHRVRNNVNEKIIRLKSDDVGCFPLSSNTIFILKKDGETCFFRECRKHKPFDIYIKECIDDFYGIANKGIAIENFVQQIPIRTKFTLEECSRFKEYVKECMHKPSFFERIKRIEYYKKKAQLAIFKNQLNVPDDCLQGMGLSSVPSDLNDMLVIFIKYVSNAVMSFQFHSFLNDGEYETYSGARNVATTELARICGLERLVAKAQFTILYIDGEKHCGVLSESAPGHRALDSVCSASPQIQRELTNLKLLDVLCFQPDHWVNNYNVVPAQDGKATSVCAFDNDCNWTFFPYPRVTFSSQCDGAPIIDNKGIVLLPHLDKEVVERLKKINLSELSDQLSPFLNRLQLWALRQRIKMLLHSIEKTEKVRPNFLLTKEKWSTQTMEEELCGKYGNTYLCQYVNKEEQKIANLKGKGNKVVRLK